MTVLGDRECAKENLIEQTFPPTQNPGLSQMKEMIVQLPKHEATVFMSECYQDL